MSKTKEKEIQRARRKKSISKKLSRELDRPRLKVFRSNTNIYGQIVDFSSNKTIVSLSSISKEVSGQVKSGASIEAAKLVGEELGKKAKAAGIETVVFDRSGYLYHGRVKAFAEGARTAGLKF